MILKSFDPAKFLYPALRRWSATSLEVFPPDHGSSQRLLFAVIVPCFARTTTEKP